MNSFVVRKLRRCCVAPRSLFCSLGEMVESLNLKAFLLLAGSFVCTAFGGLQSITILAWIQPVLLLQFLHHVRILDRRPISIVLLLLATLLTQTLGLTIAYAGEFNDPDFTVKGVLTTLFLCLIAWIILLFAFLTDIHYRKRFPRAISSHPFAFPCVWGLMWHLESSFSPIGATGNPAYTQHSVQPIVLLVALWGLDGIVFFMALTATLVDQHLLLRLEGGEKSWIVTTPWVVGANKPSLRGGFHNGNFGSRPTTEIDEVEDGGPPPRPVGRKVGDDFVSSVRQHDGVVRIWCFILIISLLYSGGRREIFSGSFYQKGIIETIKPTVGVSCILRQPNQLTDDQNDSLEFLWNATSERARAGDGLILWSETAMVVQDKDAEEQLIAKAGEIVSTEYERRQSLNTKGLESDGPYLGLTYALLTGHGSSMYNVLTLLLPNGTVGFRYEKSHPVPFVERDTIPGPGNLEAVDTSFGRISAAICFDYQFPRLLEQASSLGADIMLQPSWTWGPVAKTQLKADAFRAVENGFTLVRCSSMGQSAVVTPFYEVVDLRESIQTSVVTMELPLIPRLWTLYPYGGFLFGILVATVAMKYLFMAWLPMSWVLAVSNIFPGAVNRFFAGNTYDVEIVKWASRRYNLSFSEPSATKRLLPE